MPTGKGSYSKPGRPSKAAKKRAGKSSGGSSHLGKTRMTGKRKK